MMMKKLAFATLVAMGMTTVAVAQQSGQQTTPRSAQPPTSQSSQSTQTPRGSDRTEQVTFERADKNADGRVNREEANDIDGFDFSRADTNNDASLSRSEYQAAMATSTPREGPAANNDAGSSSSSASARSGQSAQPQPQPRNGDDVAVQPRGGQQSAQVSFDTADKNKDGKINRDEAGDVPNLNFTSADVNADASLSRQEFQTAMAGAQPRG
jgi:Ca2+-binding EF-hand superfamily protein